MQIVEVRERVEEAAPRATFDFGLDIATPAAADVDPLLFACCEGILPLDDRIADAADAAELDEIYETERRLPYVAATCAREHLLLTGVKPVSEYLADFARTSG